MGTILRVPKTRIETYQWYTKGYRYPIFETVESINLPDNKRKFATAFYYPPQEHLYLDTDPDNLALIEESWKGDDTDPQAISDNHVKTVSLSDIMDCKVYPNPVTTVLNLEYEMKEAAKVSFYIYSMEGFLIKKINPQQRIEGTYQETLDCSSLPNKNYILRITANNTFVNEVIIKK